MAFVKAAIADAREPELVPEATYKLEILSHKCYGADNQQVDDDGDPARIQTVIRIDSDDHPNAELVYHTIWLKGKEEFQATTMRDLRRFLHCFEVPYEEDGFNPEDLDGANGECVVYQREGNDGVLRHALRLPRVPAEPESQKGGRSRGRETAAPSTKGKTRSRR